jgi:hypothetical protein
MTYVGTSCPNTPLVFFNLHSEIITGKNTSNERLALLLFNKCQDAFQVPMINDKKNYEEAYALLVLKRHHLLNQHLYATLYSMI